MRGILMAFWFSTLLAIPAAAATLRVPQDYALIQSALSAAQDFDSVLVAAGTYRGEGNRDLSLEGRAIHLVSESGPHLTILDAEHEARCFRLTSLEPVLAVIEGFTLTGGSASQGAGIYINGANPTIRNCVFRDNRANLPSYREGGAIYYRRWDDVGLIENCVFEDNWADTGAALWIWGSEAPDIVGCRFEGNIALQKGGAIYATNYVLSSIRHCVFFANEAANGGGIFLNAYSDPDINSCTFSYNKGSGSGSGAGIAIWSGAPLIEDTILAHGRSGAGIWTNPLMIPVMRRCILFGNSEGDDPLGDHADILNLDPQFCGDPPSGNCELQSDSPALPANNAFGLLLGARPQGCAETATARMSWSAVKHLYRVSRASPGNLMPGSGRDPSP